MASTPCAACKLLRRKCTQECVFAPYFPPTEPHKFAFVHRVFGASNVAKILNELPPHQREDAVNSLFYEAEARLRDPIYGCVGLISILQQRLKKVQQDLVAAKNELASYVGVDAVMPFLPSPGAPPATFMTMASSSSNVLMPVMGMPPVMPNGQALVVREPSQRQARLTAADTQRMAAMLLDRGDQEMFSGYEINNSGSVTATGFNQMDVGNAGTSAGPSLALGSFGETYQIHQEAQHSHHIHPDQLQTQLVLQPPVPQDQPEGQFLIQPMSQDQPEQMQEQQPQIDGGGLGSEEASN